MPHDTPAQPRVHTGCGRDDLRRRGKREHHRRIMSLKVYDYRTDIANVLATPQIRCRFLKINAF